ncbi:hypothetical protein BDV32DRAFT_117604 [Aspergillus pseudonomiae]|uniref:Uncharacterized protein n=1 Tax=Aspergillus pseudonomiae TaxID=1506151 RepID=A0A5N6ID29_9EURO|nr:uncharacterized protein BDV37DRAFT_109266 [Aspergillus pseudonomiae]KAB8264286.1 hypothetical protein BDV32DRAFT_117604 [Aspergillus pseudonomiae]KAE8409133.1 hypothetical protein BDV37DRAFT_109266 [Aspergillus pseudonomiae]
MAQSVRIGVDVGGTNTDAVLIDLGQRDAPSRGIRSSHKAPTSPDVTTGIQEAINTVLRDSRVAPENVASVTIGTTAFLNSVLEQDPRRLSKVAIIRLSKSFLRDVKPFSEWPAGLASLINGYVGYIDGGLHIDGSQEAPVVESQVVRECENIKALGLTTVVVAGVYSPIDEVFRQEETVREIIAREIPGADVVCSKEIANIGFLERENAAILNGAILRYARQTIRRFRGAMKSLHLQCPLFLTQNDGTIIDATNAAKTPIRTFNSGATNSMRGAAYLAGEDLANKSTIVVDIGGTTTDVGVLLPSGLPRQASAYVKAAGIKVNYSMPHLYSVGLGGGSIVRDAQSDAKTGAVTVGPDSVGHRLLTEGLVFGGETLTATDIAVAGGQCVVGNAESVKHLAPELVSASQTRIKQVLERSIDLMKTSPEPLPVLLVGGGAVLAPAELVGASKLINPPFFDVANAVGAACAKVGGTVDKITSIANQSITDAVEDAKKAAIERAIQAGAVPNSVFIAEVESMPIPYISNQLRTVVKAIGDLDTERSMNMFVDNDEGAVEEETIADSPRTVEHLQVPDVIPVDHLTYRPKVLFNEKAGWHEWLLTETDLDYIADGAYVLGCGGGGSPDAGRIQLQEMIRQGYKIRCIDHSVLPDDALVYWGGRMGSPATTVERLQAHETVDAIGQLMHYMGHKSFDAVMGLEIGGSNGLEAFQWGSDRFYDCPVIDADFMGRANPMIWQTTMAVYRPGELAPCAIDSGDGRSVIMPRAGDDEMVDRVLRAALTEMGSLVGLSARPTNGAAVRAIAILNTVSLSWRIGRAIAQAAQYSTLLTVPEAIIAEVGGPQSAKVLFRGKISGIEQTVYKGHSYGELIITEVPAEDDDQANNQNCSPAVAQGGQLRIPFKNENIYAEHHAADGSRKIIASVPDLICILDKESGKPIGVPEYRYGYQVVVLGLACSPHWSKTKRGLEIGGPKGYGYDFAYEPLGEYVEPRSVIDEFKEGN